MTILATAVREHPDLAGTIITVMESRNRRDWADHIRQMANLTSRIEITQ